MKWRLEHGPILNNSKLPMLFSFTEEILNSKYLTPNVLNYFPPATTKVIRFQSVTEFSLSLTKDGINPSDLSRFLVRKC